MRHISPKSVLELKRGGQLAHKRLHRTMNFQRLLFSVRDLSMHRLVAPRVLDMVQHRVCRLPRIARISLGHFFDLSPNVCKKQPTLLFPQTEGLRGGVPMI